MKVYLYNLVAKKENSTKIPNGNAGQFELDCNLLEPCNLLTPTITVSKTIKQLNKTSHAYIPDFGRYYKVTSIDSYTKGLCKISLDADDLANWRTEIGNANLYVERYSGPITYSGNFNDTYISTKNKIKQRAQQSSQYIPSDIYSTNGSYVIGVISSVPDDSVGGVAYYGVSANGLRNVLDFIFDENNFTDELEDAVNKTFFNPFQYIVSVVWYPFKVDALTGTAGTLRTIKLGWWDTGVNARVIPAGRYISFTTYVKRVSYTGYGDFRDCSNQYTQFTLFVPSIGCIDVDALDMNGDADTPMLVHFIDILTGETIIKFQYGNQIKASYSTQFGVPVQIGQQATPVLSNLISNGLSAVNTTAKAPEVLSDIVASGKKIVTTAVSAVEATLQKQVSTNGNKGNCSIFKNDNNVYLSVEVLDSGDVPRQTVGIPYMKYATIKTLATNTFIKCGGASIELPGALDGEVERVNAYLNSGFWYE